MKMMRIVLIIAWKNMMMRKKRKNQNKILKMKKYKKKLELKQFNKIMMK